MNHPLAENILCRLANPFGDGTWGRLDPESVVVVGISVSAAQLISPVGAAIVLLGYVLLRLSILRWIARRILQRRGYLVAPTGVPVPPSTRSDTSHQDP
jgi:hypothetical protein